MQIISSALYEPVDTSKVSGFFSRYPAAFSTVARDVENAIKSIDVQASEEGSRERRRALTRHSNPYGDPFAICHCTASPERLVLLANIMEVLWIHDGNTPVHVRV